ncbi:hypothetical protein ACFL9U_14230 [Thermodesulfobacteriota bacterium]
MDEEREPPVPPAYKKRFREKQQSFDIATYDRMRVVTTELRRLVTENRRIVLRFGPQTRISHRKLANILRWV